MSEVIKEAKQIAGIEELPLYLQGDEIMRLDQEYHFNHGYQEGIEQNRRDMIINMYNNTISIETIANCANLSCEEVEKIIHDSK